MKAAPSKKPVISHYPPPEEYDFSKSEWKAAPRLCGPVFAHMDLEDQIIRLEGSYVSLSRAIDLFISTVDFYHLLILRKLNFDKMIRIMTRFNFQPLVLLRLLQLVSLKSYPIFT